MVGLGTLINVCSVVVGSAVGLIMGPRLSEKYRNTVVNAIALITLLIGMKLSFEAKSIFWVLLSLVIGGIMGEFISLDLVLDRFGASLIRRFKKGNIVNAFMTASLLFCVGPMSILGSFQDGLKGEYSILLLKSCLDGVSSIFLASSLGIGVFFSFITVLVYQGILTVFASSLSPVFSSEFIAKNFYATGGIMLVGIALNLLNLTSIKTINYVFALILIILFSNFGGAF